jgi:hypothetical protein
MTDSQKHRPGVKVTESPSKRLLQLLKEAVDIEKQLQDLKKSKNEDKLAKLRRQLCETLSDILLTDPKVSREEDCCTRLWNGCFYGVVSNMRLRISKEKKKKGPGLAALKQRYKAFLKDGLTLYDYLVGQYHEKLVPDSSQIVSQESTQDSLFSVTEPGSLEGVIENLFKLYIHIGDLHRYDEVYSKAETCYMNAAKLAPGRGNPYNQLAVIAQMKDASMTCVALYWYARSLMATHHSFETSGSNLDRLFSGNSNYLKTHSRDDTPPIINLDNKKKIGADLIKAQKAAATKSCLAHFVDVHDNIYKLSKNSSDESKEFELAAKMKAVSRSLESLYRYSVFSDSLVCKMITINTFTCEVNNNNNKTPACYRLAREFLFVLGSSLSSALENSLSKILEKDKIGNPSIRLLLPFQILCEYIYNLEDKKGREEETFWKSFVEVGNRALQISQRLGIAANSFEVENEVQVPLKEYQLLQGYRPFQFLYTKYAALGSPYIDAEEAVEVLDLTLSLSQESTSNNSGDDHRIKLSRLLQICNECADNKSIPVRRDDKKGYVFGYEVVEDIGILQGRSIQNVEVGVSPMKSDSGSPIDNGFQVDFQSLEGEDNAGDVVIYKAPETGNGPALLVPSALLSKTSTLVPEKSTQALASSNKPNESGFNSRERTQLPNIPQIPAPAMELSPSVPVADSTGNNILSPPPGLLPPPGFTAPVATTQRSPNQMRSPQPGTPQVFPPPPGIPPQQSAYGQVLQANVFARVQNPLGYSALSAGSVPLQGMPAPPPVGGGTVPFGQPWHMFGGLENLQTANPFAVPPPVGYGNSKPVNTLFDEQSITAEGSSLLDSALIDSLFMNDTKTKNPWNS